MRESSLHLLLSIIALLGCSRSVHGELIFVDPIRNLGEVRCGAPLTQRFFFTNQGPEAVEIVELRPSCGCLIPQLASRRFAPLERGHLDVAINSLSQGAGPHRWTVRLVYRAADQERETTLEVLGQLVREITVEPSSITLSADKAIERDIVLTDARTQKLTVSAIRTTALGLTARIVERSPDGSITRARVLVQPTPGAARCEEAVILTTTDPAYPELRVPIIVAERIEERVTAAPNPVTWTVAAGQPIPARIVLVRDRDDERIVVEEVTADDPAVQCRWAQGPNNLATVRITLDPSHLKGDSLRTAIRIRISKPAAQTLVVPVELSAP